MKSKNQTIGNVEAMRKAIEASPFDAVVAVSPENVRYIGDVEISTQKSIRDRLAFILWVKGQEPVYILCQVEEGYVREHGWIEDIRTFREFFVAPTELLADVMVEKGLSNGHVGFEMEYLAGKYVRQIEKALPQLSMGACDDLFRRVRMVKTEREKEILQRGFRGTAKAMLATYASVREGEDEWSLNRRLADNILLSGSDLVAFNHINAGPNTGFPHAGPSDYRVRKDDIVKADSGGYYSSYVSNVGRTAKLGKPTEDEVETWKKLREIHHRVADMLRPGNTGRQVFEAAGKLHEKFGIPFPFAHNGHSIGLENHEAPYVSPHENTVYEPGMISTVETRVRWVGIKGLHMEDLYEITENGPRLLSDAFDNEEIFVI